MADPTTSGRPGPRLALVFGFAFACVIALALVEGVSSLFLLVRDLATGASEPLAEHRHSRYDADLGWVNVPGLKLPDFYGPGRSLSINDQGFRGTRNVAARTPTGTHRVVCSGDSFTLGYGVGDEETWCALLVNDDAELEAVNMGQGGYGVRALPHR